jgi:acetylornithine deacetylase/succinyl-diaminopimelate desuccinylase-like protein
MSAPAQLRIARLAADTAVHKAFRWLHLHQRQMRRWQLEMLRIPAPPFGESARAAWMLQRFIELGLANPHLDEAGNAVAELPGAAQTACVLLSAHLDTVFPPGTCAEPTELDSRIVCPGACDNAAGLSGLLAIAAAMRHGEIVPPATIVFAANVGEEGEGDLRGMRHLFAGGEYAKRIAAAIALDGGGSTAVVTRALASRRFRLTVTGPGGHSWMDAGAPNAIMILVRGLLAIEGIATPEGANASAANVPRTTLNVGRIAGGTSVNAIAESAWALIDLRSTDGARLAEAEARMRDRLASAAPADTQLTIDTIGDRPAGALPEDSGLLATLRAVDRHLSLRTEPGLGSTDANIPLSLGIPALAIGAGGVGGGIHTLQEWYDPTGRGIALRRVLLTVMDAAAIAGQPPALS